MPQTPLSVLAMVRSGRYVSMLFPLSETVQEEYSEVDVSLQCVNSGLGEQRNIPWRNLFFQHRSAFLTRDIRFARPRKLLRLYSKHASCSHGEGCGFGRTHCSERIPRWSTGGMFLRGHRGRLTPSNEIPETIERSTMLFVFSLLCKRFAGNGSREWHSRRCG